MFSVTRNKPSDDVKNGKSQDLKQHWQKIMITIMTTAVNVLLYNSRTMSCKKSHQVRRNQNLVVKRNIQNIPTVAATYIEKFGNTYDTEPRYQKGILKRFWSDHCCVMIDHFRMITSISEFWVFWILRCVVKNIAETGHTRPDICMAIIVRTVLGCLHWISLLFRWS
jgi:hypothetical protein